MIDKSLKELLNDEHWAKHAVQSKEFLLQHAQERLAFRRQEYECKREDYAATPYIQEYIDA